MWAREVLSEETEASDNTSDGPSLNAQIEHEKSSTGTKNKGASIVSLRKKSRLEWICIVLLLLIATAGVVTPVVLFRGRNMRDSKSIETVQGTAGTSCKAPNPVPLPGKKGIGLTLREVGENGSWVENLPKVVALKPYWNYSWGAKRVEAQPDDIEFIPMIYQAKDPTKLEEQLAMIRPEIEAETLKRVLGYNEPDREKQANMSVEQAVTFWPALESLGVPLASASVAKVREDWMFEYMSRVQEECLQVDYLAIHWYGGKNVQNFKKRMHEAYEMYGSQRPLLITEFAPADYTARSMAENRFSQADILDFMKQVLPWLEQQDWIAGYSWFSFKADAPAGASSALFDENDSLTALGRFYASVTTDNPYGDQSIQV